METKKPKKVKEPKPQKSEMELAQAQADRMYRDMQRLQATQSKAAHQKSERTTVDIWKDSDFFFSVVFQSSAQKNKFLEEFSKKFGLGVEGVMANDELLQVINGLKLAEKLGIEIPAEKVGKYPYPNLELSDIALDNEKF